MHVRKFEADTMDEALKAIKYELGPDAIIIKTVTNSGVKSAFKKKKIEITAAISEEDFIKKRKIDTLLNDDQKKELYSKPSHSINEVMNQYGKRSNSKQSTTTTQENTNTSGYGKMALNKTVQQKDLESLPSHSRRSQESTDLELDDFLSNHTDQQNQMIEDSDNDVFEMKKFHQAEEKSLLAKQKTQMNVNPSISTNDAEYWDLKQRVEEQNNHLARLKDEMDLLRLKLDDVGSNTFNSETNDILKQMYTTLKTFDIDTVILKSLMQTIRDSYHEEVTEDELWSLVIEKIKSSLKIKTLSLLHTDKPMVSVFVSEGASGQTSLIYKLASKVKRVKVISYVTSNVAQDLQDKYLEKITGIEIQLVSKPSDLVAAVKEALNEDAFPLIDMKIRGQDYNNVRSLFSALRKSFASVEVIGCLSAIHSELYNKKFLHQVQRDLDLICFTHTDLCINWVSMMNVHCHYSQLPLAALSTGPMIPQDLSEVKGEDFIKNMFGL